MTSKERKDAYQVVTDAIVAGLENAGGWTKPWTAVAVGNQARSNAGRPYKGINRLILGLTQKAHSYDSPVWGTYKSWAAMGGQVKKGEHGTEVVFWKFLETEKDGKKRTVPLLRLFYVFNLDQVDGIDAAKLPQPPPIKAGCEAVLADLETYCSVEGILVGEHEDRAFYSPSQDLIGMPPRAGFKSAVAFASTLAHECAHSTGHEKRLDRTFGARFGDDAYAAEEVVAELAAALVLAGAGEEAEVQHNAAYLKNWLGVMRADNRAIFAAASAAEKAAERILGAAEAVAQDDETEQIAA